MIDMFNQPTMVVNETTGLSTASPFILRNIEAAVRQHSVQSSDGKWDHIDTDCLASVCLGCGSISMSSDREQRDLVASWYSFECHVNQTYTFVTHDSGVTAV